MSVDFRRVFANIQEWVKAFFRNILRRPVLKYTIPACAFGLIFGLLFTVYIFVRVQHKVEIDMISDHAGVSQLFWAVRRADFSEQASIKTKIEPGMNHLKFTLPLGAHAKLNLIRFDPTEKCYGKFEITRIRYIGKKNRIYLMPLERMDKFPSEGVKFIRLTEKKASMFASTQDPVIFLEKEAMIRCGTASMTKPYTLLSILSFLLWIALLRGLRPFLSDAFPRLYKAEPVLSAAACCVLLAGTVCYLFCFTALLGKVTSALLLLYGVKYLCFREWKKEKKPETVKAGFDWGMHYFRAVAIACICLGHVFHWLKYRSFAESFFEADSIYFLFISGYLAQYLFSRKPESPLIYYKKKVFNVISPYIVVSLLVIAWRYFDRTPIVGVYSGNFTWKSISDSLIWGKAVVVYWYIPFVSVLFLFTPLVVRLSSKNFTRLLFVAGVLSIIFPQRGGFATPERFFYLYTYFTFSYLFGMAFHRYRGNWEPFFRVLSWSAVFLGFVIAVLIGWNDKLKLIVAIKSQLFGIQKILFCIFFITLLGYIKDKKITWLSRLAECSFTLYFIHWIFIDDVRLIYGAVTAYLCSSTVTAFVFGVAYIFYLLFLSMLLRKIFGKHSRYFIGS